MARRSPFLSTLLWQAAIVLGLLVAWQTAAVVWPAPYLPRLEAIARSFANLIHGDLFWTAVAPSLSRFAVGLGLAIVIGTAIGLALGYFRNLTPWVRPVLEFLRFIPPVAILPASLILFGATDVMRIFIIAFGSVFPIILAAIDGARRVEPLLIDVARVNGLSASERIVQILLPASLPSIFAGIRIALSIGLVMMVISELLAADNGLGFFILRSQRLFRTADVYAGVILLGAIGFLLTIGLLAIENRLVAWHRGWRGAADGNSAFGN